VFESIRRRLLISYLGVLAGILLVFALAVRTIFAYTLAQKQIDELSLLAKAAATTADFTQGQLTLNEAFAASRLTARNEALQWFNARGQFIGQSGKEVVAVPPDPGQSVQIQVNPKTRSKVIAVTIAVFDAPNQFPTGFVRASQSMTSIDSAVHRLDWGLGVGITIAVILSGAGGVWLMRQSMQPIEDSFERLKQFTADASHELRSPLMAIQSNVQVALKYPEGMREKDHEKFSAIASATHQMKDLTEDLLFLARTDNLPPSQQQDIELQALLTKVIQLYQSQAEAKMIQLIFNCEEDLWISGNEAQLQRLFTNLLVNALHYTPAEGTVTVTAQRASKYGAIQIQDTGIGIAPEQLDKVFNRFWRAEQARSYASGGSGLGLPIAQAIARQHNGTISVSSILNQGSCFTVQLPLLKHTLHNAVSSA
jgi:two-component system, OmpR family, manganese sensing sensor histidine kinase